VELIQNSCRLLYIFIDDRERRPSSLKRVVRRYARTYVYKIATKFSVLGKMKMIERYSENRAVCENCNGPRVDHVSGGKCLFTPTVFNPRTYDRKMVSMDYEVACEDLFKCLDAVATEKKFYENLRRKADRKKRWR
jgi:hypothetical protein